MNTITKILSLADTLVEKITRIGVTVAMIMLFCLLLARVITRVTETPIVAFDEIGELATVWMIMLGAIALWRNASLYRVSMVVDVFPSFGRWINVVVQLVMLAFALLLLWVGGNFTAMNRETTAFMQIDMTYYYGAIPVSGAIMTLYSLVLLVKSICTVLSGQPETVSDSAGNPSGGPSIEHL